MKTLFLPSVLFVLSVGANFVAAAYATKNASNPVADLVLSNIPAFDVEALLIVGTLFTIIYTAIVCLRRPASIAFVLYALSLLYFIRSIFVTLTHVGPFPTRIPLDAFELVTKIFGGADLFFSGHVGATFLLALVFWHIPPIRYSFLTLSVFFAIIVLMGYLHYSIDVAAAFFIAFGVYDMAKYLFPHAHRRFQANLT
jgi:hypothetical protein